MWTVLLIIYLVSIFTCLTFILTVLKVYNLDYIVKQLDEKSINTYNRVGKKVTIAAMVALCFIPILNTLLTVRIANAFL